MQRKQKEKAKEQKGEKRDLREHIAKLAEEHFKERDNGRLHPLHFFFDLVVVGAVLVLGGDVRMKERSDEHVRTQHDTEGGGCHLGFILLKKWSENRTRDEKGVEE
jgi:hypothetical protein